MSLEEDIRQRDHHIEDMMRERDAFSQSLQRSETLAESAQLAQKIAESQLHEAQKDKAARETEFTRLQEELQAKNSSFFQTTEQYKRRVQELAQERDDLQLQYSQILEGKQNGNVNGHGDESATIALLQKKLDAETIKKTQVSWSSMNVYSTPIKMRRLFFHVSFAFVSLD